MSTDRTPTPPSPDRPAAEQPGRDRRPVDVVSLVAGIVTAVLAAAFALGDLDALDVQARVVWPTILLGVGVALLATSRRR